VGKVEYLGNLESNRLRHVAQLVDDGEVGHAVVCIREKSGDLRMWTIGDDNTTYLVGMLTRCAMSLNEDASMAQAEEDIL